MSKTLSDLAELDAATAEGTVDTVLVADKSTPEAKEMTLVAVTQAGLRDGPLIAQLDLDGNDLVGVATLVADDLVVSGTVDGRDVSADGAALDALIAAPSGGDVVGPASATDNAVARFDTTTGKLIQNSAVTIDDSGNIATAGLVDGRDVSADGSTLDGLVTTVSGVDDALAAHEADTANPHATTLQQAYDAGAGERVVAGTGGIDLQVPYLEVTPAQSSGAGSSSAVRGQDGGDATTGTGHGFAGGKAGVYGGAGGDGGGVGDTNGGAGQAAELVGGNGGAGSGEGGADGAAGPAYVDSGSSIGGAAAAVNIGTVNAKTISIGRSVSATSLAGAIALAAGATLTDAVGRQIAPATSVHDIDADRTLSAADHGKVLCWSTSSAYTITVPTSLPAGTLIHIVNRGNGKLTFDATGSTFEVPEGKVGTIDGDAGVAKVVTLMVRSNSPDPSVICLSGDLDQRIDTDATTAVNPSPAQMGGLIRCTSSSTVTVTATYGRRPGSVVRLFQEGTGQLQVVAGASVTLHYPATFNPYTAEQYSEIVLTWKAFGIVQVSGDMAAA